MSSPNSPHTVESEDGGPAFACLATTPMGDVHHQEGMGLRDYYAGQAASSMVAAFSSGGWHNPCEYQLKSIAKASWALADARLEARARTTGEN